VEKTSFQKDGSRYDGLQTRCKPCSHVKERKSTKGKPSVFKGKTHSIESRLKMSEHRIGNQNKLGKRLSNEQRLYISIQTRKHALRGSDNLNWKGGVTPENVMARRSFEYREWRRGVFERDNYTCQHCGDKKGGNLHPHHIKHFSDFPELRYDVANGVTLCKLCHEVVHGRKL
jgi:predicted restriction endonuclease